MLFQLLRSLIAQKNGTKEMKLSLNQNMPDNQNMPEHYGEVVSHCKELYLAKLKDYGPSWVIFRLTSLTDQLLIKAKRIRRLEELQGKSLVSEGVDVEYKGILNYCVMALIKLWFNDKLPSMDILLNEKSQGLDEVQAGELYDEVLKRTGELMSRKNHDYGEAWRDMRLPSITDQILVKIQRIRSIEQNKKKPMISEDIDSHYSDILNYCIFALIKLKN